MSQNRDIDLRSIESQCKAMTADQAWSAFLRGRALTVEGFAWMAFTLRHLEDLDSQDERLREARKIVGERLFNFLRKVGRGDMLPESYIRWEGRSKLQTLLSCLPTQDQKHFAEGGRIECAAIEAGKIEKRMMDPAEIEDAGLSQLVFAGGRIHTFTEQRARLEARLIEEQIKPPEKLGRAKLDWERAVAELPRGEYSLNELTDIVAALRRKR